MAEPRDRLTPASSTVTYPTRRAVLAGLGAAVLAGVGLAACRDDDDVELTGEPALPDAGPPDTRAPDAGPADAYPDTGLSGGATADDAGLGNPG